MSYNFKIYYILMFVLFYLYMYGFGVLYVILGYKGVSVIISLKKCEPSDGCSYIHAVT